MTTFFLVYYALGLSVFILASPKHRLDALRKKQGVTSDALWALHVLIAGLIFALIWLPLLTYLYFFGDDNLI